MPPSNVIAFGETTSTMTYEEGLAFIARSRRQLDRFSIALPQGEVQVIASQDATAIRRKLDDLEAEFRKDMSNL